MILKLKFRNLNNFLGNLYPTNAFVLIQFNYFWVGLINVSGETQSMVLTLGSKPVFATSEAVTQSRWYLRG